MKLTSKDLRRIIKEELESVLAENKEAIWDRELVNTDNKANATQVVNNLANFIDKYIDVNSKSGLKAELSLADEKVGGDHSKLPDAAKEIASAYFNGASGYEQKAKEALGRFTTDYFKSASKKPATTDQDYGKYFGKYDMAQDIVHRGYLKNWLGVEGEGPEHPIKFLQARFKMSNKEARFEAARLMLLLALGMDIRGAEFKEANITKDKIRKALDKMLLKYIDVPEGGNETWKKGSKRAFENASSRS